MTDLDSTSSGTRSCPACGAQNDAGSRRCTRCGAPIAGAGSPDADREDLELEEAWRSAAAEGFDTDLDVGARDIVCVTCRSTIDPRFATARWWAVRDTPTGRDDLVVAALRCPVCGTRGRAQLDGSLATSVRDASDVGDAVAPTEVGWRHPPPAGATPDRPLGDDRRFFEPAGPGTLAERGSLVDDQGEDIRQYTGEPVETEEGWVLPQQQNVGPGNEAGGGEWPDPATPSAMPSGDEPHR